MAKVPSKGFSKSNLMLNVRRFVLIWLMKAKWDTYLKVQNNVIQEWPSVHDLNKKSNFLRKRLTMKEWIKDRRCPTNPEEHCKTKVGYLFKGSKQCNSRVTFNPWFIQKI